MSARAIRHLVIRGRVQGVGYRAFAEYTALDHGLAGWVRNRRNGAVEAVLAGPASAVAQEKPEDVKTDFELVDKIGTAMAYSVFLKTHSTGDYAERARAKIKELTKDASR